MSSNLNKTCEYEEKSGTLDGGRNDTEKSGTLDRSGEDEAQSGIPYVNGEDEIQSSTFEDEISRGSRDGSFDSDMSFNGETENQMVGALEGNTLTVQHIDAYRRHVTGGALDCVVDIRESVNPVDVESQPHADLPMKKCLPPDVKRGVGRPKKSRYLSALERVMGKTTTVEKDENREGLQ
ncbi:hypothetical protein F2Q68_00013658 [Brassica cretica]|uniref:Uncharacterized protein n=1 Tax=Brassica cretica TaxID=69181 RepID=A0A8S9HCA5_BRACR|nr:hypothetical protein F2Q68_00013658 [Brassica cretica]